LGWALGSRDGGVKENRTIVRIWSDAVQWLGTHIREKARWRRRVFAGGKARVYYGFDRLPTSKDRTGGGIVKVMDLTAAFPNTPQGANILYLVSSALPPFAPLMARHARRVGARLVLNQNGVAYPGWHGPGWERTNAPMREILRMADCVLYQSGFCKLAADRYLGSYAGNSEIWPNPVDTGMFVPSEKPRSDQAALALLSAGSFCHFYRITCAVDVLRHLLQNGVRATLTFAGRYLWRSSEEVSLREAKAYVEECRLPSGAVTFRGGYTQAEAPGLFQTADVFVHPQYNDACPRLVVEAMACGVPVVFSASGGVPELVGEEAGIGVPAPLDWDHSHIPDPMRMADAVARIAADRQSYMVASRRRAVERFDLNVWIARHVELFGRLLS
jgi:glycosyltransferase involved in cell wall biosynthesis